MAYLDVSPMITALRSSPEEFTLAREWMHHPRSGHRFQFGQKGDVRIDAPCACSRLSVSRTQGVELWEAYQDWTANYWRPLQINQEFASHFRPRSPVRKLLIAMTARLHHWLVNSQDHAHAAHDELLHATGLAAALQRD